MNDKPNDRKTRSEIAQPRSGEDSLPQGSSAAEIAEFIRKAKGLAPSVAGSGRLIFALDATMSRQPTWDMACKLQAGMFDAVHAQTGFSVQLVYFRGLGECRASRWTGSAGELARLMERIDCRGGQTQIVRVLRHALDETARSPVSALVFVGDAMEENIDRLCVLAGELRLKKVPCFMFHEGGDTISARAFAEIARISGGAFAQFDRSSATELAELLRAVATYASGGRKALELSSDNGARKLLAQLTSPSGRAG